MPTPRTWIAQRSLKPRSRAHYETLLNQHIAPVLGWRGGGRADPGRVRGWYATTLVDRPTYRGHAYGLLRAILATAVTDGLLDTNPCQIERATTTHRRREPTILSVAEVGALAEKINPEPLKALVLLSAWCGLRFGEVIELRRKDVGAGA